MPYKAACQRSGRDDSSSVPKILGYNSFDLSLGGLDKNKKQNRTRMMWPFRAAAYASPVSARRSNKNVCLHKPARANAAADLDRISWGEYLKYDS